LDSQKRWPEPGRTKKEENVSGEGGGKKKEGRGMFLSRSVATRKCFCKSKEKMVLNVRVVIQQKLIERLKRI